MLVPRRGNRATSILITGLFSLITEANQRQPRQPKLAIHRPDHASARHFGRCTLPLVFPLTGAATGRWILLDAIMRLG
jgi:hypothetical protein